MAIVSDVEIRLMANIARLQSDMTSARRTVETATDGMAKAVQRVKDAFASLAVGIGLGAGLSEVVKMSDAFTKYTAQLKLASASQTDYANSLVAVKRIATDAQSSLEKTGVLYARIANGTRDLGLGQQKVADITETVSLALKVSGATAEESSSAMLQLSQAFASGALRGEEFNAVNEAAPRLMKALADGLGVPVGALKDMATQGKLTSEVLATTLPKALSDLRSEGAQIQTISGAFQVLKDRVMEFTATQAQANGTVSVLTTGIGLLADNLGALMSVLVTVGAAKFGSMLAAWTTSTYRQVTANAALGAANLTVANTQATNTAATLATTTARVAELRASIASAEGDVALAIALNGLVPAQARAAAAAAAHTAALGAQAAAARATSLAVTVGSRALGLLGGPVGAVITVLGLAATAWSFFGSKSEEANKTSTETTSASTAEVVAQLQKQIEKLNERNALFGKAPDVARGEGPGAEKQRDLLKQIDDVQKNNNLTLETKTEIVRVLTLQYGEVTNQVYKLTQAQAQNDKNMNGDKLTNWLAKNTQYLSDAEKTVNTIAQARKELGDAFTPEVEKRIRDSLAAPDAKKYATEVQSITKAIQERTAASTLDAQAQGQMTDGQAYALKLMEDIRNGTLKLTLADKLRVAGLLESMLAQEAANTGLAEAAKWYKKVGETAAESRAALEAEGASVEGLSETRKQSIKILVELEKHGAQLDDQAKAKIKLDRAQLDAIADLNDQRKRERELQDQLLADSVQQVRAAEQQSIALEDQIKYYGLTEEAVLKLKAAELARQLAAADADSIEAGRLAGLLEETQRQADAQQKLAKMKADTSFWTSLEDAAHQTFLSIGNGSKDLWTRMKESAKNIFFEWLYQMTLKKWIINIGTSFGGTGAVSGIADAVSGGSSSSGLMSIFSSGSSLYSAGKTIYSGFSAGIASSLGTQIANLGNLFGSQAVSAFGTGLTLSGSQAASASAAYAGAGNATAAGGISAGASAASAVPIIGWIIAGMIANSSYYKQGWRIDNQKTDIAKELLASTLKGNFLGPIGAVATVGIGVAETLLKKIGISNSTASLLSGSALWTKAFGHQAPTIESQGVRGTIDANGVSAEAYANILEKGGWFRSDKRSVSTAPLAGDTATGWTDTIKSMVAAVKGFGSALGIETTNIDSYTKSFDLKLTGDATKDNETVLKFFSDIGDELSVRLVPALASFQTEGEALSATLARVVSDYTRVGDILQTIGKTMGSVGLASLSARENLIKVAGGLDALTSGVAYFQQNFLTDAERLAPVQKQLAAAMAELGLSSVTTNDQFKQTLLGLDLNTEAGAKLFTQLLALAPAFKTVTDAADAAAKAAADLAAQQAAATQAALEAAAAAKAQQLADNETLLHENVGSALDALKTAIDARKGELQTAFEAVMSDLADQIDKWTGKIADLQSLQSLLAGAKVTSGQNASSRASAQAQIEAALAIAKASGVLPSADSIKDAISAVTADSSNQFSMLIDYQRAQARAQNSIAGLAGITDDQLSTAEKTLQVLKDQKTAAQAAYDRQIAALDALVSKADAAAQIALGTYQGIMSIDAGIQALAVAINALKLGATTSNPTGSGLGMSINDLYKTVLGRDGEAAGIDFWTKAFGSVIDSTEYADFVKAAQAELATKANADWAQTTAPKTDAQTSSGAQAALDALNTQMASMQASMARTANATQQLAQQFDNVSAGGNALATVTP